jgi:2'-5' RNA ligase
VRWTRVENIHLTLKFLGEIESRRVNSVKKALQPLSDDFSSFALTISGSGCFPGEKRPRIFWLGMEQDIDKHLCNIHKWIDTSLSNLNFEREKRRFSPHLTIGRVRARQPVDFSDLFVFLEKHPFEPVSFDVEKVYFMQSFLKPTGAEYKVIESYTLR